MRALANVELTIEAGEFFTLLGPSGCGKTTLLRTIAGFERQDSGAVVLGERTLDDVPPHARNTGLVFQNYALFPHMTVAENVAFGLQARKLDASTISAKVTAALSTVHLQGLEARTPDQLSGGQQQRVGIARALVIEPDVLLMDEPLSNLDAKLRAALREEIRDIQRRLKITTVYVTHDQEEALAISDRIAVMSDGVIRQAGAPWEIYREPADRFVASFVGRLNFLNEAKTQGVRPEDVALVALDGEAPSGSRSGTVTKRTFTGSLVSYVVDTEGATLVAEQHLSASGTLIAPGTQVQVDIAEHSILHFDSAGKRAQRP